MKVWFHNSQHKLITVGVAFTATILAITVSGCALTHTEPICPGGRSSVVLVALTSAAMVEGARESALPVAQDVANRAADSCAVLSTGIADAHPESDMALDSISLEPAAKDASSRTPWIAELHSRAEDWLHRHFLGSLMHAAATPGAPVLNTIAAVASQEKAAGRRHATLVEITNAAAVEMAPDGGNVDFAHPTERQAAHLRSFVPSLGGLKGGCVIIVDAGSNSGLPLQRLEQARRDIDEVLDAADIGLAWTRSLEVPATCRE